MTTTSIRPYRRRHNVLLVDDSENDQFLTKMAFSKSRVGATLHIVNDGDEAMAFMRRQGKHASAPKPDLVLLDLNMPLMNGREVLSAMRADPDLRRIPVVILTSSQADDDLFDVYDLGANACITKPFDLTTLVTVVLTVENLWFVLGHPPPR